MIKKIDEAFEPVHNFIIEQSDSVVFWVVLIFIGLTLYGVSYTYLSKD